MQQRNVLSLRHRGVRREGLLSNMPDVLRLDLLSIIPDVLRRHDLLHHRTGVLQWEVPTEGRVRKQSLLIRAAWRGLS
jgi:hypothetical protein